jgi:type IV secretory pathway VirB6-like protein
MSAAQAETLGEEKKNDVYMNEYNPDQIEGGVASDKDAHDTVNDAFARGQMASGYETMSIPQTIKTFKMACLVCFMATFAAATDGYQIGEYYTSPS